MGFFEVGVTSKPIQIYREEKSKENLLIVKQMINFLTLGDIFTQN